MESSIEYFSSNFWFQIVEGLEPSFCLFYYCYYWSQILQVFDFVYAMFQINCFFSQIIHSLISKMMNLLLIIFNQKTNSFNDILFELFLNFMKTIFNFDSDFPNLALSLYSSSSYLLHLKVFAYLANQLFEISSYY